MHMAQYSKENHIIRSLHPPTAYARTCNLTSIARLRGKWDTFDYETQLRAAKTIRCLETQEPYR